MGKMISFKKIGLKTLLLSVILSLFFIACSGVKRQDVLRAPLKPTSSPTADEILGGKLIKRAQDGPPLKEVILSPGQVLTLIDCLRIAEERSLSLDSAEQNYLGQMWTRWQSITEFLPTAGTKYQYLRRDQSSPSSFFSEGTSRNNHTWDTTVSQTVFAGFKNYANYRLANIGLEQADIQRIQVKEDLILLVKQAYYSILNLEKSLDVSQQTVKGFESHLNVSRNFYDVGMVPKSDVLEAEVNLAEAVQAQTVYEHNLLVAKTRLNTLLRQPVDAYLSIVDNLRYSKFPLSQSKCIEIAMIDRPELKIAKKTVEGQRENITVARSQMYPQVNFQTTHSRSGDTMKLAGGPSIDRSEWYMATVASFNFWEWGRTVGDIQKSKINLNRSLNEYQLLEDEVQLEVTKAYQDLLASEKNIAVSSKAIDSAAENLRMIIERYRDQVSTSTDVLDAQTRYSQAQYNYYAALYNFNLAWATLEKAIGRQVKHSS